MPFVEINVKNEIEKQRQNDPKFRKAWDDSRAEYKLIGEMISLRKQERMTQKELAEAVDVSRQTINMIEKGEYNPTIKLCCAICRALDKTLDDLFWEEDE